MKKLVKNIIRTLFKKTATILENLSDQQKYRLFSNKSELNFQGYNDSRQLANDIGQQTWAWTCR